MINYLFIKIDIYLVYMLRLIWPTIFYKVNYCSSLQYENVKDSKKILMVF